MSTSNYFSESDWKEVMNQHQHFWNKQITLNKLTETDSAELLHAAQQEAREAAGIVIDDSWSSF